MAFLKCVCLCLLADCYVADELIVSRAGRRVRVGNTDAEGRMVMVDLLCEMKEKVYTHTHTHVRARSNPAVDWSSSCVLAPCR